MLLKPFMFTKLSIDQIEKKIQKQMSIKTLVQRSRNEEFECNLIKKTFSRK